MASESEPILRVALLGAGNIATTHLAAIRQLRGIELVGVTDLNYERAVAVQKQAGIANAYRDVDTMLRECRPQIVHVLLPPTAHCEAAVKCLEAGSHVFAEKPFCVTVEECRRVGVLAKSLGLKVGVNHNMAFTPAMMRLIGEIRTNRLGALEHVTVMYTIPMPGLAKSPATHWMFGETGRIMLEIGPHPVSIICRLLGGVKDANTAVSGEITLMNQTRFFSTWMSTLVCERGTANLVLSTGGGYSSGSVQVAGQDGTAFVDLSRDTLRVTEKTRYIRAVDLADGLSNGISVMRPEPAEFSRLRHQRDRFGEIVFRAGNIGEKQSAGLLQRGETRPRADCRGGTGDGCDRCVRADHRQRAALYRGRGQNCRSPIKLSLSGARALSAAV